ncbi:N-acetylmuramoyl-L-alanine amidase [Bacillus sp. DTU_2020_1000418_1_SI_GHA_SEK_038]|uniref:N-acetylmuramoyl-L-alanine amidase n=1 Tax=Bacillus sp. DTU_2020_1000418_1_SI_GHA_SEK_038 TaxID=3077585 RepID=UPI0028E2C678|nr:N-acetylmuramoyl-L-alanine amidase [Bacillus sp. DTU_2020_1000418_1_SI_GHA_SEK_038]WNS75048.1 N-acetylmuramoyl-L-alanine amidase [Bacillus sp. DTU_2020_1000418_1_SI_GHA_SEK_038]
MKIMLDAGHGFNTAGKRSPDGMNEYEFTRAVANFARPLLENHQNTTVYFAHSDERDVPLQERTNKANSLKIDVYVAIHANAYGSTWNAANGIETYVHVGKPKEAYELAQKIQRNLVVATGLTNRGVKTEDFHVLRETNMTAVLTECGFMTNRHEAALMRTETYQRTCAEAIVKALKDQYSLKSKANSSTNKASASIKTPQPSSKKGLYKVQVGAFKDKKNAENLAEALKKLGYSPFVYFE